MGSNSGSRGHRRRRRHKSVNHGEQPRSIVVEMGRYFDGQQNVPMVKVIRDGEATGHLMGIPIEEFQFDISEGQKFKIICEPL